MKSFTLWTSVPALSGAEGSSVVKGFDLHLHSDF